MALAARDAGLQYLAITDHSKALAMANGLDEHRALAHARRIREIGDRLDGITLLAGIECDIRPDGSMDLADDCLAELDVVVASVHSAFNQDEAQMTDRMLRAIANPFVDIIGHPTGRILLRRDPYKLDVEPAHRRCRRGRAWRSKSTARSIAWISPTPTRRRRAIAARRSSSAPIRMPKADSGCMRWGVQVARRAWLTKEDVLNTRGVDEFRKGLTEKRGK